MNSKQPAFIVSKPSQQPLSASVPQHAKTAGGKRNLSSAGGSSQPLTYLDMISQKQRLNLKEPVLKDKTDTYELKQTYTTKATPAQIGQKSLNIANDGVISQRKLQVHPSRKQLASGTATMQTANSKRRLMATQQDKNQPHYVPQKHTAPTAQVIPVQEQNLQNHEYTKGFDPHAIKVKLRGLQAQAELEDFFLQKSISSSDSSSESLNAREQFNQSQVEQKRRSLIREQQLIKENLMIQQSKVIQQHCEKQQFQLKQLEQRNKPRELNPQFYRTEQNLDDYSCNSLNDFKVQHQLGSGAFATVRLATHIASQKRVALKIYAANKLEGIKRKAIQQEIMCMRTLNGLDSFPRLYWDFETETNDVVIVQEYISGRSLLKIMQNRKSQGLQEWQCKKWFKEIAHALKMMHQNRICHRDLKMDNILITDHGKAKIIDFGFSVMCDKDAKLMINCGTPAYMAPEIVKKQAYSGFQADIWALGIIAYMILTGKHPFKHKNEKELFSRIVVGEIIPNTNIQFEAMRLINKMLSQDPSKRPSASEICGDAWLMMNNKNDHLGVVNNKFISSPSGPILRMK